jgi:protein TonB
VNKVVKAGAVIAGAVCVLAGCATGFQPVAPQPMGFGKENPCNENEPVQRVQPEYPRGALSSQQPGWVALQYDVTVEGTLTNISVSASSPEGTFDQAATTALQQWRYPASDGAALSACRILFTFRPPG